MVERSTTALLFLRREPQRFSVFAQGFCTSSDPRVGAIPNFHEENEMSELRQRMNDAMVLRGFSARTKESYLACVTGLAKYYRRSPDTLDAAAIQT